MTKLDRFRNDFELFLKKQSYSSGPQNLYEPIRYIMGIGGKRIRPVLTLLAADLFEGDALKVLPAAYGVELFHNFSLVHDDIMDEAPLRRGHMAVHKKFGRDAGILSGDVMLVYVYQYLLEGGFEPEVLQSMLSTFNQAAIEVCEGQQLDMDFENMQEVPLALYLEMINKKTAALLWASLKLGALPFAKDNEAELLGQFGRNLGMAFQLRDDYLDTFGEGHKTGKQEGGDILQHKKTILYIHALEHLASNDRQRLLDIYGGLEMPADEKVKTVQEMFRSVKGDQSVLERISAYEAEADKNLKALNELGYDISELSALSDFLMNRVS